MLILLRRPAGLVRRIQINPTYIEVGWRSPVSGGFVMRRGMQLESGVARIPVEKARDGSDASRGFQQAIWRSMRACRRVLCGECRRGARPDRTKRRRQDDVARGHCGPRPGRFGRSPWGNWPVPQAERRQHMFYLPDGVRPWSDQYAVRVLEFFAGVYGRSRSDIATTVAAIGLEPVLGKRVVALSKGYARRMMWALALIAPHPLLLWTSRSTVSISSRPAR
jgi:hypothetical protein